MFGKLFSLGMEKIVSVIKGASKGSGVKADDDFADRLNSRYTVALIVAFAIVVSGQQYFIGKPLNCWEPKHFTGSHVKYMNSYCWVRNTYYLPFDEYIPRPDEVGPRKVLPYYQWIPFIMLGQAFFFFLPSFFWHGLNDRAGVDSDDILSTAHKLSATKDVKARNKILEFLSQQFHRFLRARDTVEGQPLENKGEDIDDGDKKKKGKNTTIQKLYSRRFTGYLLMIFLISKVLYIANVIGQFFVLNLLLGTKYGSFGYDLLSGRGSSGPWKHDVANTFPLVTMCDFQVRRLGNVHKYTVQCVLPINMYNEKIYVFLWFWFLMVAIITVLNFLFWLIRSVLPWDKKRYVTNHLATRQIDVDSKERLISEFVDYLRHDGVFLIRLIGHNCNFLTTNDITGAIWDTWERKVKGYSELPNPSLQDV
ncbi:DgyrCDS1522 [Dimorphilus gyrociliatus]|uniref:Innexin n=1 Tax=Dimorphilus gyrociliatus TaxID=2664684 RepID=A0A7I8V9P6_9ANNE|nr:DgyrCDS1522 [Dimorphilus gyrociliatus]